MINPFQRFVIRLSGHSVTGMLLGAAAGAAASAVAGPVVGLGVGGTVAAVATSQAEKLGTWMQRRIVETSLDGMQIDENHTVLRELRIAQLTALDHLLGKVAQSIESRRRDGQDWPKREEEEAFVETLQAWLKAQLADARNLAFGLGPDSALTEAERELRAELLRELPDALDLGLADRRLPAAPATPPDALGACRRLIERLTWTEIAVFAFGHPMNRAGEFSPPLVFTAGFQGDGAGQDGFFGLFIRDAAKRLKSDDAFQRIWGAEQLSAVKRLVEEVGGNLDDIREAVQAQATALAAFSGDVEAVRALQRAVHNRVVGDGVVPLDFPSEVATTGHLRFAPRNPRIPFYGRLEELEALHRFLAGAPRFSWWLLSGAGGASKTRLGLRLAMEAHARGWRAGFLPGGFSPDIADLDAWQPRQPTLILVDYALARRQEVLVLAERLARRGALGPAHAQALPFPVRLLLIEREGGPLFDAQFLAGDTQGVVRPARHEAGEVIAAELSEDDLWHLCAGGAWRDEAAPLLAEAEREAFFARFDRLDSRRRPLVGMILAEAMGQAPEQPEPGSLREELVALLQRDRLRLWPSALGCAGAEIGAAPADPAIAFATMVEGLGGAADMAALRAACGGELPRFDAAAAARATGSAQPSRLSKLEPDLIGECFALEVLAHEGLEGPRWSGLAEQAWRHRPQAMQSFALRVFQNFPAHPATGLAVEPVSGVLESWALAGFLAFEAAPEPADAVEAFLVRILPAAEKDVAAAQGLGALAILVAANAADFPASSERLLAALRSLAEAHPAEPSLREEWAKAVMNHVNGCAASDPSGSLELLSALWSLAEAHPAEPALREPWARAAAASLFSGFSAAPDPAHALCADILQWAGRFLDEPALLRLGAIAVAFWLRSHGGSELARPLREDLLARLQQAAQGREEIVIAAWREVGVGSA